MLPPPPAIPCPTPRVRAAAFDRHAAPPREVGPALFGRGLAPAPAVSLSSSARPSVPTPLSEAASAHLSPPPTTDPKPPPGPSGHGPPARRWAHYRGHNLTLYFPAAGFPFRATAHSPSSPAGNHVGEGGLWRLGDALRSRRVDLDGGGRARGAVAGRRQPPSASRRRFAKAASLAAAAKRRRIRT